MKISLCHDNWDRGKGLDKNSAHCDSGETKSEALLNSLDHF